jgi:hypothetical protein
MFFEPDKVSQLWEDRTALGGTGTSRTGTGSGMRHGSSNRVSSIDMRSRHSATAENGSSRKSAAAEISSSEENSASSSTSA